MQKITRTELAWLVGELDRAAANARNLAALNEATNAEKALFMLRADNLAALADKLNKTAENGDKRIEVLS